MPRWRGLSAESPIRQAQKTQNKDLLTKYNAMRHEDGLDPISRGALRKKGRLRAAQRQSWENILCLRKIGGGR